ncbi:uncharacterized protein KQ657_002351 [Scheffersomyces spartinae]|uniref:Uncharacterized protein n=1 Tax=Scheffersomyces spartinae TaxID=45513 RepID=A0A9P8ALD4_9ASCO|nr:uncharacterized protein KQ657_002351 [Scheffersomyces spartinae]KAG7195964.1 hypothetical protein KQ657_002351 [Scheffersomyces spartinae]
MSSVTRPKRFIPSATNTPITVHINKSESISKDESEQILNEFILASEAISSTLPGSSEEITFYKTGLSNSTGSNAVLAQLRRIQRDLRGLPPMAAESPIESTGQNKRTKFDEDEEEKPNKKIKFDEEEEEAEVEEQEVVVEEEEEEEEEAEAVEKPAQEAEAEADSKKTKKEKKDKKEKKEKKEKKDKKEKKEKKHKSS